MEVKTNKEYHAMQTEIASAETVVRREEDRLLERMEEAETPGRRPQDCRGRAQIGGSRGDAEPAGDGRRADGGRAGPVENARRTRAGRRRRVDWRACLFERVSQHRKGLAMSEARDGLCTQCHVRLRPQVYNELRHNQSVMQCESCSRILRSAGRARRCPWGTIRACRARKLAPP